MLETGNDIALKLASEGVYLNERELITARRVSIGLSTPRPYCPNRSPLWVKARVYEYESGVLDCNIIDFNLRANDSFFSQTIPSNAITKLILCGSDTGQLLKLTDARRLSSSSSRAEPQADIARPSSLDFTDMSRSDFSSRSNHSTYVVPDDPGFDALFDSPADKARSEPPKPIVHPIVQYQEEFTFHFNDMQIVNGAALFNADFYIPKFCWVSVELRVENDFLTEGFNYIKPYIARRLGRQTVKVPAVIQTQGPKVISNEATAPVVSKITPDLIMQVKHSYIRRKLRDATDGKELVTVDRLFDEDDVNEAGLKPDDPQFVKDILSIRKPKHGDHLLHLSAHHLHQVMRLRMLKKPFAFLFLLPGEQNSFFVLETLNNKDATYLWALNCTESERRATPELLRHKYEWVEHELSLISAEGRDAYRKDNPDHFHPVWHEYEQKDGFAIWKDRLRDVLDG